MRCNVVVPASSSVQSTCFAAIERHSCRQVALPLAAALGVLPPAAAVRSPAARFQVEAAARLHCKVVIQTCGSARQPALQQSRVILQVSRTADGCSAERSSAFGGCSVACGSLPGGSRCAAFP